MTNATDYAETTPGAVGRWITNLVALLGCWVAFLFLQNALSYPQYPSAPLWMWLAAFPFLTLSPPLFVARLALGGLALRRRGTSLPRRRWLTATALTLYLALACQFVIFAYVVTLEGS